METPAERTVSAYDTNSGTPAVPLCLIILSLAFILAAATAQAQTFSVIHTLNGGSDGSGLITGLAADRQGNLYGVAYTGGIPNCPYDQPGCGTVFKLARHGTGWIFSVIYSFIGVSDGWWPQAIAVASDGSLYGITSLGGDTSKCLGNGCGTVFRLQPPATFCASAGCPWRKTTIFQFGQTLDGRYPVGLTLDRAGNIYGTTNALGENGGGTLWELSPSNGGWTFKVLYAFTFIGANPLSGVALDASGNIWGSGDGGIPKCGPPYQQFDCGVIYELTPSPSGWTMSFVYNLTHDTGGGPLGTFTFDQAGNMYGTVTNSGANGNGGVFQFVPSSGQLNLLYAAPGNDNANYGPQGGVALDQAGNLYAADPYNGAYGLGYVFQVTPSKGNWIYTDLHNFTNGSDGSYPYGPLVVDAQGKVYGANAANVIFEITP